jgi:hypothetical protein
MVSQIELVQSNVYPGSNLICVHNPIVFIANATYSGEPPNTLDCIIKDENEVTLGTYKCIPWLDIGATTRQFIFVADQILRGFMGSFDDFIQSDGSLEYCEGFTKKFHIYFNKYQEVISVGMYIVALQGVRQFGDDLNAIEIFNNVAKTYIGAANKPVYVYCYNDNIANDISINPGSNLDNILLDYDDTELADYDDQLLTGKTT